MTRGEALRQATARLAAAGIETPSLDARRLLLDCEGIESSDLAIAEGKPLIAGTAFAAAIERRIRREPVSKILGYRDFWTHRFAVTPDVLDPRPDTETVVEAMLEVAPRGTPLRVLDLGTGSGCILLSILSELPLATGLGTDISEAALAVARRNAAALGLADRCDFLICDWFTGLDETFDLVVSNPPYIPTADASSLSPEVVDWDPDDALFAGMDGLQAYRTIVDGLASVLKPAGTAALEVGIGQAEPVSTLLRESGFSKISSRRDLGGIERCVVVQR